LDLNDTPEQAECRARARAWLEENRHEAPPRSGSYEDDGYTDARRAWQRRLAQAGLAGVTWPQEFGGQGLGPIEQVTGAGWRSGPRCSPTRGIWPMR
jgi:alkylation response protein AidB-like acyl-CoA dehydrogenase